MAKLETVPYGGWDSCHRLSNGVIDLVVTGQVGPRVIRFGFSGQGNLFCEVAEELGRTGGDAWRMYGGHRFWHAPEDPLRTYQPDNAPVEVGECSGVVRVVQPLEAATGIQKQLDIEMEDAAHVRITHRLINRNLWQVTLAPWALSVMTAGGTGVIPLPPRGPHPENLLPPSTLSPCGPTPTCRTRRWTWGGRYILLRQDEAATRPQKFGADVRDGWVAYVVGGYAFVKLFTRAPGGRYPDLGSSVEVFTNDLMLELETLGRVQRLEPGGTAEHVEDWFLFEGVAVPVSDAEVEATLLPLVHRAQAAVAPALPR